MISVRLISRKELLSRLAPYKCKRLAELGEGIEIWETGWKYPFTMQAESGGMYDEWQYRKVLAYVIAKTIPPGWMGNGNGN